jgi:signal transduction histidine kinase
MGLASIISLSLALVVAYVAAFHAWIYLLRRQDSENLWFALAATAIAGFGLSVAMLYAAETAAAGCFWQRSMFLCSAPLLVGFLQFSFGFLEVDHPRVRIAALVFAAIAVPITLFTDWVFTSDPVARQVDWLSLEWTESSMSPFGQIFMSGYFVFFVYLIGLYAKHLRTGSTDVRTLLGTLLIWFVAALNDAAVGMGLHEAPYFLGFGYLAIVVGISSILVRRFVHSVDELADLNETLHERVESRSEDLREKEVQLAHGERLAAIGTLAASVAHEINNPIAFVHSNLNRLEELWAKPEAEEDVTEILQECREGTERVRLIVSDLLSLARRSDRRSEAVDLHEVISSVLPVVRKYARHRAQLETELRGVPRLLGDPLLLGQVVLNLVMNALQAIPEGEPERNRVGIATFFDGKSVWLRVEDTGPGIPEEVRERIFDAFYTTKPDGTGLGLAVTHQIVTRHHGELEVETGPSGTRIVVRFPERALVD